MLRICIPEANFFICLISFTVRQEIKDRFSGAVEAFTRRNVSGTGLQGDHLRHHRSSDDVPSSKDVVSGAYDYLLSA